MKKQQHNEKGFTIIEVVLVLAIAALIFLVVFLALPALQRSQRDTQRKNDASRFVSQLTSYASNNNGKVPANTAAGMTSFVSGYLTVGGDKFEDPKTGAVYTVTPGTAAMAGPAAGGSEDGALAVGTIVYFAGYICDGELATQTGATNRNGAIRVKLEGSGIYCQSR